jgi:hypothetical protein
LRRFFIFLACSLLWTAAEGKSFASGHPAVAMLGLYGLKTDRPVHVNPYLVSILALHSIHAGRHTVEVRDFIQWALARLNASDRYGLRGTMDDYSIGEGWEKPTGTYDSADGYAGLFLSLLWVYAGKTADQALLDRHRTEMRAMASVISSLADRDGLTAPFPKGKVKYLMNNCEAYGGIRAFNRIQRGLGPKEGSLDALESTLKKAILSHFYNPKRANFFWAVSGDEKWESHWEKDYPDAFAQIFPVFYGLLEEDPETERSLWQRFMSRYEEKIEAFPLEQSLMIRMTRDRFLDRHKMPR